MLCFSGYDYAIVSTYAVVTVNIHSSHVDHVLSVTIYLRNHFESTSFRIYNYDCERVALRVYRSNVAFAHVAFIPRKSQDYVFKCRLVSNSSVCFCVLYLRHGAQTERTSAAENQ